MFQVYPRDPAPLKMALLIKKEKMFTGSPQLSGWRVELNCFWAKVIECLNANMETSLKWGCQRGPHVKKKEKKKIRLRRGKWERSLVTGVPSRAVGHLADTLQGPGRELAVWIGKSGPAGVRYHPGRVKMHSRVTIRYWPLGRRGEEWEEKMEKGREGGKGERQRQREGEGRREEKR